MHGAGVIGTEVPASPEGRQRQEGAAGDRRTDLRRQAMGRTFGFLPGPAGKRAPEETVFLSRDAVPEVLRNFGEQSGTR